MKKRAADYFHPAVTFFYTAVLIALSMLFFSPVFIALGLFFAVVQYLVLCGAKRFSKQIVWLLPLCVLIAAFNPIVSKSGKTLLFYLFGNPVTLESTFYGACSGGVLLLVFLYFGVYNCIVTPDRFMYLFSRIAPALSMLVTMTQRMIPLFSRRFSVIATAQKTMPSSGGFKERFRTSLHEISILLCWSMEEGLDTADSMKSRGYGCAKRTAFSVFRFTKRDAGALIFTAAAAFFCLAGYYLSEPFYFYPRLSLNFGPFDILSATAYAVLASALPFSEARWAFSWKKSQRSINNRNKDALLGMACGKGIAA